MKSFFVNSRGQICRHKRRSDNMVGCGMLQFDQKIIMHTTANRKIDVHYEEVKVGSHHPTSVVLLGPEEEVRKIDIVTIGETYES